MIKYASFENCWIYLLFQVVPQLETVILHTWPTLSTDTGIEKKRDTSSVVWGQ